MYKGALYAVDEAAPEPQPVPGSIVAFSRNGAAQGVAFRCCFGAAIAVAVLWAATHAAVHPQPAAAIAAALLHGPLGKASAWCNLHACAELVPGCRDIVAGKYFPAVSMFTLPHQKAGATVMLNFGEPGCASAISCELILRAMP